MTSLAQLDHGPAAEALLQVRMLNGDFAHAPAINPAGLHSTLRIERAHEHVDHHSLKTAKIGFRRQLRRRATRRRLKTDWLR